MKPCLMNNLSRNIFLLGTYQFFLLAWLSAIPCNGQTTFQKAYLGTGGVSAFAGSMQPAPDGGFILSGASWTNNNALVVRTDSIGNILWSKDYGGDGFDAALSINPANDGGWLIAGNTRSFYDHLNHDIYILKIDDSGTLEWSRVFADYESEDASSIISTSDGGYMVVGLQYHNASDSGGIFLAKLNPDGDSVWTEIISGIYKMGVDIKELSNGNFIILADDPDDVAEILEVDANGNVLWSKGYGDVDGLSQQQGSIQITPDGGFAFTAVDAYDDILIKTDSLGEPDWIKGYDFKSDDPVSMIITNDGGYLMTGGSYLGSEEYSFSVKTDMEGTVEWSLILDDARSDIGKSIIQAVDGGYLILTTSSDTVTYDSQIILLKIDSAANSGCGFISVTTNETNPKVSVNDLFLNVYKKHFEFFEPVTEINSGIEENILCEMLDVKSLVSESVALSVSPNPTRNYLTVNTNLQIPETGVQIEIIDNTGKIVMEKRLFASPSTVLFNLPPGLYFIELINDQVHPIDKVMVY